jgi:DNA polymerase phi
MMQLYWDLASLEPMERWTAAQKLVEALKTHIPEVKEGATVESLLTDESAYALKRLVRGLPSSRDAARQGFSLALSQVKPDMIVDR